MVSCSDHTQSHGAQFVCRVVVHEANCAGVMLVFHLMQVGSRNSTNHHGTLKTEGGPPASPHSSSGPTLECAKEWT